MFYAIRFSAPLMLLLMITACDDFYYGDLLSGDDFEAGNDDTAPPDGIYPEDCPQDGDRTSTILSDDPAAYESVNTNDPACTVSCSVCPTETTVRQIIAPEWETQQQQIQDSAAAYECNCDYYPQSGECTLCERYRSDADDVMWMCSVCLM